MVRVCVCTRERARLVHVLGKLMVASDKKSIVEEVKSINNWQQEAGCCGMSQSVINHSRPLYLKIFLNDYSSNEDAIYLASKRTHLVQISILYQVINISLQINLLHTFFTILSKMIIYIFEIKICIIFFKCSS